MKIIHLIFSMKMGGAETMLIDIANEQSKFNSVTIIILNNEYDSLVINKLSKNIEVVFFNRRPSSKSIWSILKLNFFLLFRKFDVIHCHNHNMIAALIPFFHYKSLLTVHDTNIKSSYFFKYKTLVSISRAVQRDLKLNYNIFSDLVYNGIVFSNVKQRITKNYSYKDDFKIVQVSRLDTSKKGQHILLKSISHLNETTNLKIKVDFIGEGNSLGHLEDLVKEYRLDNNVKFLGLRDRNYVYNNLRYYDLLVQPSLFEGFGLTIVEAMAAKIPVLVSGIEGPLEVIQNGKIGYSFHVNDYLDLATKLKTIINDIGQKLDVNYIYSEAMKCYSIEETVKNYTKVYEKFGK